MPEPRGRVRTSLSNAFGRLRPAAARDAGGPDGAEPARPLPREVVAQIARYHALIAARRYDEAYALLVDRLVPAPLDDPLGAYATIRDLLLDLFPDGEDRPPRLTAAEDRAWTAAALAIAAGHCGHRREAAQATALAIRLAESAGDRENVATGLVNRADDLLALGELRAAEASLRRSLQLAREDGHRFREAAARAELGRVLAYRGAFAEAEREIGLALGGFERLALGQGAGIAWAAHAHRSLLMDDPGPAATAARQALDLAQGSRRAGDAIRARALLAAALAGRAARGDDGVLAEARDHAEAAHEAASRAQTAEHRATTRLVLATVHHHAGEAGTAHGHAAAALATAQAAEERLTEADAELLLARLALATGDRPAARAHARLARDLAVCDGVPYTYAPVFAKATGLLGELGG